MFRLTQMCLAKHLCSQWRAGWHFQKVTLTQFCSTIKSPWLCVLIHHQKAEQNITPFRPFHKLNREMHSAVVSKELNQEWSSRERPGGERSVCACVCSDACVGSWPAGSIALPTIFQLREGLCKDNYSGQAQQSFSYAGIRSLFGKSKENLVN